jgi:hypothetical protein
MHDSNVKIQLSFSLPFVLEGWLLAHLLIWVVVISLTLALTRRYQYPFLSVPTVPDGGLTNIIWHSEDHALWYIFIIKGNEMNCFSALFVKELYMFRTDLLSIIKSLNTVFTAMGICHTEILKMGKITSVYTCTL